MAGDRPRTAQLCSPGSRLEATFIPGAGMLGWSLRHRGDELLGHPVPLADVDLVPTGDVPMPVAFGFHPYLRLAGLERERWWAELPVTSRMLLDERMLPTCQTEPARIPPGPLGDRTYDDAFDGLADPPEFVLGRGGRRLSLAYRHAGADERVQRQLARPGAPRDEVTRGVD